MCRSICVVEPAACFGNVGGWCSWRQLTRSLRWCRVRSQRGAEQARPSSRDLPGGEIAGRERCGGAPRPRAMHSTSDLHPQQPRAGPSVAESALNSCSSRRSQAVCAVSAAPVPLVSQLWLFGRGSCDRPPASRSRCHCKHPGRRRAFDTSCAPYSFSPTPGNCFASGFVLTDAPARSRGGRCPTLTSQEVGPMCLGPREDAPWGRRARLAGRIVVLFPIGGQPFRARSYWLGKQCGCPSHGVGS